MAKNLNQLNIKDSGGTGKAGTTVNKKTSSTKSDISSKTTTATTGQTQPKQTTTKTTTTPKTATNNSAISSLVGSNASKETVAAANKKTTTDTTLGKVNSAAKDTTRLLENTTNAVGNAVSNAKPSSQYKNYSDNTVNKIIENALGVGAAETIKGAGAAAEAPGTIASTIARIGSNLLEAPVTDMRSRLIPEEITPKETKTGKDKEEASNALYRGELPYSEYQKQQSGEKQNYNSAISSLTGSNASAKDKADAEKKTSLFNRDKSAEWVTDTFGNLANWLLGTDEPRAVEREDTVQNAIKDKFAGISGQPVKQVTEWTDPWNSMLSTAVQNADRGAAKISEAVAPLTDWTNNFAQELEQSTYENVGKDLTPNELFISNALGQAVPNVIRNTLSAGLARGSDDALRVIGDVLMFLPAFTSGYQNSLEEGLSDPEARARALLTAGIEVGTEHMFDVYGVNGGQTGLDRVFLDKIESSNLSPTLKWLLKGGINVLGENAEEVAAEIGNAYLDAAAFGGRVDENKLAKNVMDAFTASTVTSLAISLLGGEYSSTNYSQYMDYLTELDEKRNQPAGTAAKESNDNKVEAALIYASMSPDEAYDFANRVKEVAIERFGEDNELAQMDTMEIVDTFDQIAEELISAQDEETLQKKIDRIMGNEDPIAVLQNENGEDYEVYEYLGDETEDQEIVEQLGDENNINVIIVDSLWGNQDAVTLDDGTILISAKAQKPVLTLFAHEAFHALREDGTWQELRDLAFDAKSQEDGFQEWFEQRLGAYAPYYGQLDTNALASIAADTTKTRQEINNEIRGEIIRQAVEMYQRGGNFAEKMDEEVAAHYLEGLGNEQAIRNLYNRNGNVFQRVWQTLQDVVNLSSGKLTNDQKTLLKAERLFSKVIQEAAARRQQAMDYLYAHGYNFLESDGTLYSLGYSTGQENLANIDRDELAREIHIASDGAISEKTALQYIEDEEVMAAAVKDTALDYVADPAETAIKSNAEYPQGTVDLNNNCTKRRSITYMTNRLQEALPTDLFTADDYADIRLIMMDDGSIVACGLCFVEDRRKQLGEIAQDFREEWTNPTDGVLYRTNSEGERKPVSIGKDLAKRYGVKPGVVHVTDVDMSQVDFGSSDRWHEFQQEQPYAAAAFEAFNRARGQNAGRLLVPRAEYKREILSWSPEKVKFVNSVGGLRIFSFSDFEAIHMLDIIQIIEDCAAKGVMMQGYTKQSDFARLVRDTGIKVNRSMIPYGVTGLKQVNGQWVLAMNTKEGMDITSEDFIDETDNPDIGNNITGINDQQVHVAMTDDFIHQIIPFHTNKSNAANDRLGVGKWKNYKAYQTEWILDADTTRQVANYVSQLKADGMSDTDALDKALAGFKNKPKSVKENVNIYTEVLADPAVTDVVSFQEKFFDVCYENGLMPRFAQFLNTDEFGNYVYTPGYEKFLVDFKLFDSDGNILPQQIVRPVFDREFMQDIIDRDLKKTEEERQGADYSQELYDKTLNFIKAKHGYADADYAAYDELKAKIDSNVNKLNSDNNTIQPYALSPSAVNARFALSDQEWDQQYFDALNRGAEEEARRLRLEHAAERGYTDRAYHGTQQFGFTTPDTSQSDDRLSFFVTDSLNAAQTYSGDDNLRKISDSNGSMNLEQIDEEIYARQQETSSNLISLATQLDALAGIQGYSSYSIPQKFDNLHDTATRAWKDTQSWELVEDSIWDIIDQWMWDAYTESHGEVDDTEFGDWMSSHDADRIGEAASETANSMLELIKAEDRDIEAGIYDLLINADNLLRFDAGAGQWNNIKLPDYMYPETIDKSNYVGRGGRLTTRGLAQMANDMGYSGYEVNNLYDDGGKGKAYQLQPATVWDLFHPERQVKSADTVTYDDNGNVIPLSQRDNPDVNDVRWALSENARDTIDKVLNDVNYEGEVLLRDNTPSIILGQQGTRDLPMLMNASHIRENILTEQEAKERGLPVNKDTHYHGLGKELFLNVLDNLDNVTRAYRGTKNAADPSRRDNYFLLISRQKDENGRYVNVPVHVNQVGQYNRVFIDTNKIATLFGRDDLEGYIRDQVNRKHNLVRIKNRSLQNSEQSEISSDRYDLNASNTNDTTQDTNVNSTLFALGEQYPSWQNVPEQEGNWGYHAGNLGKAEPRASQGYYRGTGHFGTGTYFVGNPSELRYGYGERPVESVDFSQYNLFKPQNSDDAYTLHEFLKAVDGGIFGERTYTDDEITDYTERASEAADTDDPALMRPLIEEGREMMGDYFQNALDAVNRWNGTRFSDSEQWNPDTNEITPPVTTDELMPYGSDTLYAIMDSFNEYGTNGARGWFNNRNIINRSNNMVNDVARMLGITPSLARTLAERIDTANFGEDMDRTDDSLATKFMKALGYEGVDTRNIPDFDNTRYGSVIYDLKGNDLERKQANGARFALADEIPEQANAFPDRNYPQDRSAMRTLGQINRETNNTDAPLSYESTDPSEFEEPYQMGNAFDFITETEAMSEQPDEYPTGNDFSGKDWYNLLMEDEEDTSGDPDLEEVEMFQSFTPGDTGAGGANRMGSIAGFKDLAKQLDYMLGKNTEQRKFARDNLERPFSNAQRKWTDGHGDAYKSLHDIAQKTGVWEGTKESAAAQWYGEGVKKEDGVETPYTLDDLKKDFPETWQNIVEFEQYARQTYQDYIDKVNAVRRDIYGDPNERHRKDIEKWQRDLRSKENARRWATDQEDIRGYTEDINELQRKIANTQRKIDNHDYEVGKFIIPRKNYFHHFNAVETAGVGTIKNILKAIKENDSNADAGRIDPELVPISRHTKPKTKWQAALQRRGNGEYTADAVGGLRRYIDGMEYAIAYDPLIAQNRDFINRMIKATKQTKNANALIQYLSEWTNSLAGKTSPFDRFIIDSIGNSGNRGKVLNALEKINQRGKSNAVVGNVRSAVAQFFNIPNARSIIKSDTAWAKGLRDYYDAKLGNRELLDQSPFLAERYQDLNASDFKVRETILDKLKGKTSDILNEMMEFGDREAAELIWLSAYNEAVEKGIDDKVFYADDMTRRSIGGRGIGEIPYNMKSKLTNFIMPFQLESNNQWQNLKQMVQDKDASGVFRLMLATYLMNAIPRFLFNDNVLSDPIDALIEGIRKLFDKNREETTGEVIGNTLKRTAGETVSMIPGTSLWLPLVMGDNAETFFGDASPTRYGTGAVGLKNVFDVAADAIDGDDRFDLMTPLLQLGLPVGGKQASRLYNTLQDMNIIPSNGFMNTPFGGETNPTRGDYSKAGALKYQLPEEVDSVGDAAEIARAFLFGSNATNAASEYYDTLKPVLNKTQVEKLKENPEVDPQTYIDYVHQANTDGKNSISQAEAYDWLSKQDLSDEERNALWSMTNSAWTKTYDEYTPQNETIVENADTNGDGRVTQAEAYNWLSKQDDISDEEKNAMWDENGWSTSYDKYDKAHKGVLGYNRGMLVKAVDTDGNGQMKQTELYTWLQNQGYTEQEKSDLWDLAGWKTDYQTYINKMNGKKTETPATTKVKSMDELMGKEAPKSPSGITNRKELLIAADSNNDGYMSQAEAYAYLSNTDLSEEEKEALWNLSNWKTSYQKYAQKNG